MIAIQDLHRKTLINPHEVAKVVANSEGLDLKRIQNSIIVAEERFIRPLLGYEFYEQLLSQKNIAITNANKSDYQTKLNAQYGTGTYELKEGEVVSDSDALSADNKVLWKEHLWSITAECVMVVAYPANYADFTSSGIVHNAPKIDAIGSNNKNTPELATIKWQIDKMVTGRIDPLINSFNQYICINKAKYPLYKKSCDCGEDGNTYAGSTVILTGVYDDN